MNLATLPEDFPLLGSAAQKIDSESISIEKMGLPPDIFAVGERTFIRFSLAQLSGHQVDQRYWRYFPYAIWLEQERSLSARTDYLSEYFEIHLPRSLKIAKRAMKWAEPLFYVYLYHFKPNDPVFETLAQTAQRFFASSAIKSGSPLKSLTHDLNLLNASEGPYFIAESILKTKRGLMGWINQFDLWPGFASTAFAHAAFIELLKFPKEKRRQEDYIHLVFDWGIDNQNQFRYLQVQALFNDALLLAWKGVKPPDDLKAAMSAKLISVIGDPRAYPERWQGTSSDAVQVLLGWLNTKAS
ncbi:EH signature domain-containing protein [Polynucleobacter sp. AP-Kaivos-20-H2]|uniref:EH signature domain-containing protein n=1 Tax=Polynucleobacter sp. AP-Kaivos-20-H2 TaxID=2689104 RepID=UPI001C0C567E|nr:EH signature domain-containing protein [Polynucleobacter sp. AP-Kaivos-20-H2]MBU3603336.1 hypothetical protein [Polynucleobacter sp. AP-Kaivos-20-H2]